ncbi:peptide/nickel transport system permease protein [Thermomonospora echinospora]|uniref:Peptide/nickel transport system permease protein n=1 Tax=Thermomonospora echinospora TaxID=1992 RepID=A0A1H6DYI6_9ACTN|nr:ABC transporter permease [Thermomonospora echinospora]SEG90388.1 peptide/nickel transport system permease protein [Thermomonospora echinospora]
MSEETIVDEAPSAYPTPDVKPDRTGARAGTTSWLRRARARGVPAQLLQPSLVLAVLVLVVVVLWALFPGTFAPHDPYARELTDKLAAPSPDHPFGTDNLGRDYLSRFIYGSRTTLVAALLALAIGFTVSVLIGLPAGYLGGVIDEIVGRLIDIFLAVPGLLISLMLVTSIGFGTVNIAVAVGAGSIATFTRVLRAEVLRVRRSDFVTSAVHCGVRWPTVLRRHILPHAIGPMIALAALEFGTALLSISALSFLGFGAPPPTPEWGSLVSDGRAYLAYAWWLTTLPGLAIVLVVVSANRVGTFVERIR